MNIWPGDWDNQLERTNMRVDKENGSVIRPKLVISLTLNTYYNVYNSDFEDTLKNTSFLPRPGFEPGTSSCGTRKESFCARLRLPLAAPSREYFSS